MSAGNTEALRSAIEDALPERPFTLEFWDGGRVEPTTGGGPVISFRSPEAIRQVLRAPGELGLGRAYVTGSIDIDDIDKALGLLGRFQAPPMGAAKKAKFGIAALRAAGLKRPAAPARRRAAAARQAPHQEVRLRDRPPPLRRLQRVLRALPR